MHIPPMIGIYFNGVFSKLVGCAYSALKLHTCTHDINAYHQLKNLDSSWKCTNVSFQKLEILKHVFTPNKSLMTRTLYEDEKSSSHWFNVLIFTFDIHTNKSIFFCPYMGKFGILDIWPVVASDVAWTDKKLLCWPCISHQ